MAYSWHIKSLNLLLFFYIPGHLGQHSFSKAKGFSHAGVLHELDVQISEPSLHLHVVQGSDGEVQVSRCLYGPEPGIWLSQSSASSARVENGGLLWEVKWHNNGHFHWKYAPCFWPVQYYLFWTLTAICDPALELHACIWSANEVCALCHRWQRVFKINNYNFNRCSGTPSHARTPWIQHRQKANITTWTDNWTGTGQALDKPKHSHKRQTNRYRRRQQDADGKMDRTWHAVGRQRCYT